MKRHYLGIIALGALGLQNVYAEDIKANENDTIKTYNMGEVIVTSSTKETNNLRTLPGSVSILSPQMISGRQIDALKDISSFVPNLYMPDYGAFYSAFSGNTTKFRLSSITFGTLFADTFSEQFDIDL